MRGLCLLAAATLLLANPVRAGLFDDDEARHRIEKLRTDVAELTKRAETVNRNQLDFANQTEAVRGDVAKLRGQIEVLAYELEAAQKRQKDFYVDLDSRMRKLEQAAAEPKVAAKPKVDPSLETHDYEAALAGLKASKFAEAGGSFLIFIKTYPESSLLASAHYWGGYAHTQAKDPARAAELFGTFATRWPNDDRAPSALESQAAALDAQKNIQGARATLELLVEKYPNSDAAKRARVRLKKK
jgi:tol-pal system protein YbgF